MTPEQLAKSKTEHAEQVALFAWCNMAASFGVQAAEDPLSYKVHKHAQIMVDQYLSRPDPRFAMLFAIHNQGHGDAIRGSRAKAEGVKAGVPDLLLAITTNYAGLFIELKKETKGKVSAKQVDWLDKLEGQKYKTAVCFGYKEAIAVILEYLGYQ